VVLVAIFSEGVGPVGKSVSRRKYVKAVLRAISTAVEPVFE
jgi:hypothetical protein